MKTIVLLNCHGDDVFCFRKEIVEALLDKGYKVVLSCPEHKRLDYFRTMKNVVIEDVSIDRRGKNPIRDLKLLFEYVSLYRKHNPDVVCSFTIKPNVYGSIAADMMGIPHINNITGIGSGYLNGGIVKSIVKLLYRLALRKSNMVFFQNEDNQEIALKAKIISEDIPHQIIPGSGVNLDRFAYQKNQNHDGSVVFNYIGRVMKDKRIDDYLKAAIIVKEKHPNVVFNIIGFIEDAESHYLSELQQLESQDIIHYCGCVDDVCPFIYASDAIIHPSAYGEGISNVLLETAACGRAVITTDVPGCIDCVEDGVTGLVYHVKDVTQLVDKIEQFIAMPPLQRMKMGEEGRKKVERMFDRNMVVDAYIQQISKILN